MQCDHVLTVDTFLLFSEGQEEVVIAVTRNGFSVPEVTVMEGQSVIFVWQEERMDVVQVRIPV